jgi:hypothetical protein
MTKFAQAAACILALGLLATSAAHAGVSVGLGIGKSQFDYTDIDDGSARKFFAAYEIEESPLYFEFASIDSGDADITSVGATLNVSGIQVGLGYRAVLNQDTGSGVFIKGGFYSTDSEVPQFALRDGNSGVYLGIGADWMWTSSFGLRFDLEGLMCVEDFADDNNVTFMTFGPIIRFGRGE